jgi:hydrogen cyanide synthase HcnC
MRTGVSDIAVVGCGVVGLSIAYGLARRGLRVTLLDEGDVAHRASRGNFALVWVQGKGIDLPDYARWTLRSARAWRALADDLARETGMDLALSQRGGLTACLSEAELEERAAGMRRLHNAAPDCAAVETLGAGEMLKLVPELGPEVVGGLYCRHDGHVNSLKLFGALHAAVRAHGVSYLPNAGVQSIASDAGGFRLDTEAGLVVAGRIVLASGLGNARLAPQVGLHAPLRPQRGQVMVTEKLAPFLNYPLVTIRQTDEGGVMIGDSKEEVGFNDGTAHQVLGGISARAIRMLPLLAGVRIVRSWGALRVMSPDGYPVYDRSLSHPGAWLVSCHSGVTLAAIHADAVAGAIAADDWPAEMETFSARRFADVPAAA